MSFVNISYAMDNDNVWDVLRNEFHLDHETSRPEVRQQIRWIVSHPDYIRMLSKSEPYMYHIISEIKKRNLPGELALMPMIESSYNPFAFSGAGASGLWQIMPGTGREFGLKQDWWHDSRRSISNSTKAALKYLTYLNNFFHGNWILACAAYDAGEGAVARSMKNAQQNPNKSHFWSLSLPRETKEYIPKLLALAEVIENPKKYNIKLPNFVHKPYFQEVNIGSQIDLMNAANLAGISYHDMIMLNPEYNRWATAPTLPYKLLIPINKVKGFQNNLAKIPANKRITWYKHKLNKKDNLQVVANKFNTNINLLKHYNNLKSNSISNEQYILIPKMPPMALYRENNLNANIKLPIFAEPKQYKVLHIISATDTYQTLQTKYNVSNEQLKKWNYNLSLTGKLLPGQSIIIWRSLTKPQNYIVKYGDSLSKIARDHNKSITTLISLNPNLKHSTLKPGQEIKLS